MMEKLHTPEPWGFYQTETTGLPPDPCPCLVIDTLGREIPSTNPVVCIISDISSLNKRDHSNARRIVACVNACAGINTEVLEAPGPGIETAKQIVKENELLTAQRDELLAALKRIEEWNSFPPSNELWPGSGKPISYEAKYGSNGERDFMRSIAREAIKRATHA